MRITFVAYIANLTKFTQVEQPSPYFLLLLCICCVSRKEGGITVVELPHLLIYGVGRAKYEVVERIIIIRDFN